MKQKSYIMPIVLLIFSLVVVAFFSIYHRTLNTHNHKNSKEKAISKKLKEISLEEILSTKATLDFVNNKLNKRENFNLKVNINDLLKVNNINDFSQNFENYDLRLNSKKVKKKLNFYDRKSGALSYFVRQYEIFFEVRNNNELTEYKIVDKNRIENYLFDLQVKGFVDGKLKMLSDDFYFNLNNDFSNLHERIFSNEIQNTYSEDLRIYDYKEKIYFMYNEQYLKLLKDYLSYKGFELESIDINLCDIDNLKNCSREDFIKNFLLESSEYIKDHKYNIINIDVRNKLYFDLNTEVEIYSNIKIDDSSEIIVTDKSPKIQGVFVNKSNKEKFDFNFEGILFSKNKLKSKYKFLPEVLDLTARFVKISDNFYLEKIQKNDIK
ncbi:hypothetical protein [Parvimonas micra]|uniref:hypothetical protein n=1 Tax=Parvimonas micra TaxID=33033 RepID=UPI00200607B7|nr:hypothetical protein [Parvimonas micra]MCK6129941.1 hypothetical protein [Parvimonas micra]MCK6135587.1 hypothetical protein [Parvimonas micra]MCK6137059.1 hypothetical protein [Parvimonas micra]MCK6153586.1 hypothetical protein [Parvimonas micra]